MFRSKLIIAVVAFSASLLASIADAHYVWLERDGDGVARVYFGEWQLDIREKAGGLLDRIKAPRAFVASGSQELPIQRRSDHLEIAAKGAGDVRLVESGIPPREDKEKGGATRTVYYAKAGRSETAAKLDLELVPTTSNGNTFRAFVPRRAPGENQRDRLWTAQVGKAPRYRRTGTDNRSHSLVGKIRARSRLFRTEAGRNRR